MKERKEETQQKEVEETKKKTKNCRLCGGKVKNKDLKKECIQCNNQRTPVRENNSETVSPTGDHQTKSGHARTHSIVINLDDSNRFTEEVTV